VVDSWPSSEQDQIQSWLAGYRRGATYAEGFARLWQQLFRGRGLLLLDPTHPRLRQLAAPVFRRTLEEAEGLDRRVRMRAKELRQAGYHVQVRLRENATFLFLLEDGQRQALRRRRDGFWIAGAGIKSRQALLSELEAAPERFSSNVLLRPVVQDWLLPTAAVVAGPNEITYLAQASVLYDALLGWVPAILPRASFTLVEAKVARLLGRYRLGFADVLAGRAEVRARMAVRHLPPQLRSRLERTEGKLETILSEVAAEVAKLDPTLRGAVKTSERKMLYQYGKIRRKASRAQAERTAILDRHLEVVMNSLYPEGGLQERSINFLSFLACAGRDLVGRLLESTPFPCRDHQVVSL
jgi:bacillithiol biosynthesis cysteine-adding enzyme BshC